MPPENDGANANPTDGDGVQGDTENNQPTGTDDQGAGGEGGEGDAGLPEKFQGKTAEEIAQAYTELESKLGEKGVTREEITQISQSLSELKDALTSQQNAGEGDGNDDDDSGVAQRQKEYFRSLGFVTQDEVENAKTEAKKEVLFDQRVASLEKEYNGEDGRPKFDRKAVAEYAQKNELWVDPETVYKIMNEKELTDWHIKNAQRKGKGPHVPDSGRTGTPAPKGKDTSNMSDDEFKQHLTDKIASRQ